METYFRYRHTNNNIVHEVPKCRNGKPWSHATCNMPVWGDVWVSTRSAVNCDICTKRRNRRKRGLSIYPQYNLPDAGYVNADPDDGWNIFT